MKQTQTNIRSMIVQGALTAMLSAFAGSLIFVLIEGISLTILFGFDLKFFTLIFVASLALSLPPSVVGGGTLAFMLQVDAINDRLSKPRALLKGILFGALAGVGICIFVYITLRGRGQFDLFLIRATIGTILASLGGGWTGWKLASRVCAGW